MKEKNVMKRKINGFKKKQKKSKKKKTFKVWQSSECCEPFAYQHKYKFICVSVCKKKHRIKKGFLTFFFLA